MSKVTRMEKISWNGPYADEKYTWQCNLCHRNYVSRNEAQNCYDHEIFQQQLKIELKELIKKDPTFIVIKKGTAQFPCIECSYFDGVENCTKKHVRISYHLSKLIRCV